VLARATVPPPDPEVTGHQVQFLLLHHHHHILLRPRVQVHHQAHHRTQAHSLLRAVIQKIFSITEVFNRDIFRLESSSESSSKTI
jgi:hypothetical protein